MDVLHRPKRKDDKIFTIKATLAASKRVFDIFRWKREQVAEGCRELMEERALAQEDLADSDVELMRRQMDEARARRLQPHYIEWTFRTAFDRLGGRMAKREKGRWEISHVPSVVRAQQPPARGRAGGK